MIEDQKIDDTEFGDADLEREGSTLVAEEVDLVKRYKVLIHNDNYTPMDFVVMILQKYFHKKSVEAENLMLTVHKNGSAIAGIYPKEIAETKVAQVKKEAKEYQYPLRLSLEEIS